MVLLALPPADHLLIERDRGQVVPSRRRRMMANARAERLLKIPAEPSPELRIPAAAAQTRVVSLAGIRLDSGKSVRSFKGIICHDISEFESSHASHAVQSLCAVSGLPNYAPACGPHRGGRSSGCCQESGPCARARQGERRVVWCAARPQGHVLHQGQVVGMRLKGAQAPATSTVLMRLAVAGSFRIGALHMSEFAYSPTGHNSYLGPAR